MKDGIGLRRKWVLAAEEAGMIGDEYVYIFSDIKSKGYCNYFSSQSCSLSFCFQMSRFSEVVRDQHGFHRVDLMKTTQEL